MLANVCRLAAVALVLFGAAAPVARADGDPASDILAQRTVYYGSGLDLRSKEAAQLPALLDEAKRKGFEIRVAVLTAEADLGATTYLWGDPYNYAPLLGSEIAYRYGQRILVVMPAGYAAFHEGHSSVRDQKILDRLPAPDTPGAELTGAMDAVRKLAAAQGVQLTIPDTVPPPGGIKQPASHYQQAEGNSRPASTGGPPSSRPATTGGGGGGAWLFALPLLAVVLVAGGVIVTRRVREARSSRAR